MKEPFIVSTADLITQTQVISDMQLQSYLGGLASSQQASLLSSNINTALAAVSDAKGAVYADMMNQATGADNNILSAAYYLARTRDLADAAGDMDKVTLSQLAASEINAGLNERQKEINEWSNSNKLDTLYFMQVLFISLSLTGFLAFLSSNGSISQPLFTFVSYIIGILAAIVLLLRWRYTQVARDPRYWHKARFSKEGVVESTVAPKCKKGWFW